MPKVTLSARSLTTLTAAPSGRTDYFDRGANIPGFGIRVAPGHATWFLLYRQYGRLVRYKVGTYPPMLLADARETARRVWLQTQVAEVDPSAAKKARRTARTFAALAYPYIDDYARPHKKSWRDDARRLRTICLPKWKTRAAADIQPVDVRELLRDVVRRRGGPTANRTRALLSKVFRWAKSEGYLDTNPTADIGKRVSEVARERVLSNQEIVTLWSRLENPDVFAPAIALGLKLRLLLGQRASSVNQMQWAQIDWKARTWDIPGDQMKAGHPHIVPLPTDVISLLKDRRKAVGPDSRYVLDGGRARNLHLGVTAKMGLEGVEPKDLRRTCATGMARRGASRFIVGRVLGHVDNSVTGIYDRFEYLQEKRVALDAWGRHVRGIVKGPHARSAVVPFARVK
jgi:integrase